MSEPHASPAPPAEAPRPTQPDLPRESTTGETLALAAARVAGRSPKAVIGAVLAAVAAALIGGGQLATREEVSGLGDQIGELSAQLRESTSETNTLLRLQGQDMAELSRRVESCETRSAALASQFEALRLETARHIAADERPGLGTGRRGGDE